MEILLGGSCIVALTLGMIGFVSGGPTGFLLYAAAAFTFIWLVLGPVFAVINGAADLTIALRDHARAKVIQTRAKERVAGQLSVPVGDGALSVDREQPATEKSPRPCARSKS